MFIHRSVGTFVELKRQTIIDAHLHSLRILMLTRVNTILIFRHVVFLTHSERERYNFKKKLCVSRTQFQIEMAFEILIVFAESRIL